MKNKNIKACIITAALAFPASAHGSPGIGVAQLVVAEVVWSASLFATPAHASTAHAYAPQPAYIAPSDQAYYGNQDYHIPADDQ